jgi:hypothetical protein
MSPTLPLFPPWCGIMVPMPESNTGFYSSPSHLLQDTVVLPNTADFDRRMEVASARSFLSVGRLNKYGNYLERLCREPVRK